MQEGVPHTRPCIPGPTFHSLPYILAFPWSHPLLCHDTIIAPVPERGVSFSPEGATDVLCNLERELLVGARGAACTEWHPELQGDRVHLEATGEGRV